MSSQHNISDLPPSPNKKNEQKKKQNTPQEILNNIKRVVKKNDSRSGPRPSIYRVPKTLRDLNKKAYTPSVVSIGPLHCKDQHLKTPMADIKMNYVNSFLVRMVGDSDDRKLELLKQLINEMQIIEETKESSLLTDPRKCYAEEVDDELDEEMLVIDGCFILELLYKFHERSQNSDAHDPIFGSPLMSCLIRHDLLRLENQLPFSALDKLFLLTKKLMPTSSFSSSSSSSTPPPDSLIEYVRSYFSTITDLGPTVDRSSSSNSNKSGPKKVLLERSDRECHHESRETLLTQHLVDGSLSVSVPTFSTHYCHILHILVDGFDSFTDGNMNPVRESLVNSFQKFFSRVTGHDDSGHDDSEHDDNGHDDGKFNPSASELVDAGVKLQPCTSSKIKFYVVDTPFGWCRRARFEIPTLTIDDSTELFFRNLIAFEQCFPGFERRFTSYAILMDKLISTVKDVEVLEKAGVIRHCLGSREEAVHLFNKLCKNVSGEPFRFKKAYEQATAYTKRYLPTAIAYLRREYFATPWTTIAFAAGFIAFGITVTNFIQSFLP